ncbi:MAG: dienelactone hydrolase family protein [Lysobacteraceae bacterium]
MKHAPRNTIKDFDPDVLSLFDDYVHGRIDRRGFFTAAGKLAIGATAASGLLAALSPRFAEAQQVSPDDARLKAIYREFDSPNGYGRGRGYLVRPVDANGPLPKVLVVHENRGLNPHIEDVTRRIALEGYVAFAPDALFPLGGYPGAEDSARALFQQLDQDKTRQDFLAASAVLRDMPLGNGRMGVVGFCYGGSMAGFLATRLPDLDAAAPFYGSAPDSAEVANIRAEMLVVLAEDDQRVNAQWPAFRDAMVAAGVTYALFQPPGTVHGFNNDTTPRYDEAAAAEAWSRMLALFERRLKN